MKNRKKLKKNDKIERKNDKIEKNEETKFLYFLDNFL